MCLGYRDAHGYASLSSKWQHRRQSWEKGSLQIPKCWCAVCSRNRKPSADGNRELPNSANKSPVEKAVDRKRRGAPCRPPGAAPPSMAFPSRLGGEGAPLGGGRKPGWDGNVHFFSNRIKGKQNGNARKSDTGQFHRTIVLAVSHKH